MKLEQSDAELFYQLWFPLLDFVNRKHHVCPETETIGQRKGIDARNAKKTLGCLLLYAARFDAYDLCAHASWARFPVAWLWSRRLTEPPRPADMGTLQAQK